MNVPRQQAINYLRAPADAAWRWADNGGAIVWKDGTTIAFREEIAQILEWLAPNGLPPFGSIAYLLAATRGKIPSPSMLVGDLVQESVAKHKAVQAQLVMAARKQFKAQVESALAELGKVAELPKDLRMGIQARCVLAEAVFEDAKAERHVVAKDVLDGIRESFSDAELNGEASSFRLLRQIHIVSEGLKKHNAESLALRMRTGLDSLPKPMEDENLPISERARRLIDELSRDPEIGALGRAARELMAAVRLPRRLGERDELAIGGVADITNRGPLDRLLLSELAHDDLTLAVRVALNEALYLRREPPMREPPGALALLLDSGVRLWGVPRALATAVALALIARDKQHSEIRAWRAAGAGLQQIDLLTREGIADHLSKLGTEAHAGKSIAAFAKEFANSTEPQSVLITHPDALNDPDFRRALGEAPNAFGFIATVDRTGRFEMHALPLGRRAPMCEADLDLQSIFEQKPSVPVNVEKKDPSLPAIFGVRPFPFLLPLAGKVEFWTTAHDGFTYAIFSGRRLAKFRDASKGGRQLCANLPGGRTAWMEVVGDFVHIVKHESSSRPARLVSVPVNGGPTRVVDLAGGAETLAAHRNGDVILLIRTHDVRAYALSDGRTLGRTIILSQWVHSRFFRDGDKFSFVSWDGSAIRFEPVTLPPLTPPANVTLVFDRAGKEGPWALSKTWTFLSTATGEVLLCPQALARGANAGRVQVSRNGNRIFVFGDRNQMLIDLGANEAKILGHSLAGLDPAPHLPYWNLFRLVESIALLKDGIALRSRVSKWRKITLINGRLNFVTIDSPEEKGEATRIAFSLATKTTEEGWQLQKAEWPGGSTAYLDSRGLLHLKSHDRDLAEISLVLADSEIAGWTAFGNVCGPPFFFENDYKSEPEKVFDAMVLFAMAELRHPAIS